MTVRVVLEFEDEENAKEFVGNTITTGGVVGEEVSNYVEDGNNFYVAKLIGVFKKPTKYCDPMDGHRGSKTSAGWTRGKKYGWWVCAKCGKPTERWASGSLWPFSLGFNLLPKSIAPWAQAEGGWQSGVATWKEFEKENENG